MSLTSLPSNDVLPLILNCVPFEDVGNLILVCCDFYNATPSNRRREFQLMIFLSRMRFSHHSMKSLRGKWLVTKFQRTMTLPLGQTNLATNGVSNLARAISKNLLNDCKEIDLSRNALDDADIAVLLEATQKSRGLGKLEILNLCSNKITSVGWNLIADGIRQAHFPFLYFIVWSNNLEEPTTELKEICRSTRPYIRLTGLQ